MLPVYIYKLDKKSLQRVQFEIAVKECTLFVLILRVLIFAQGHFTRNFFSIIYLKQMKREATLREESNAEKSPAEQKNAELKNANLVQNSHSFILHFSGILDHSHSFILHFLNSRLHLFQCISGLRKLKMCVHDFPCA